MDNFYLDNKMKSLDDWYNIINQNIRDYGGYGLLNEYEGSISKMIKSIYPNHNVKYYLF